MFDFTKGFVKLKSIPPRQVMPLLEGVLVEGELPHAAFETVRDKVIFTSRRIIAIDVQGVSGVKVDYVSIPYKRISIFSCETAGAVDRDAELTIFVQGYSHPIRFDFASGVDICKISQMIAFYC
ncbi:MAG: PH domain-containing protein [Clostridia bacterium]|nr:PH domain-containing protein [Clostridia bacterium]